MSGFVAIDLSLLPVPAIVEPLDFETVLADLKADLAIRAPDLAPVLALESEPVVKLLETVAYREIILRARVNDAARAVLLPTATGADLDNLAAFYGVARLEVTPANPLAIPPTPAEMETDTALRRRVQLALEGFSTAGPIGAYLFHTLTADGRVKDAAVASPVPGEVRVTVLSTETNGTPTAPVLAAVTAALNAEDVRPLCDLVTVQAATIVNYAVTASLTFFDGPDTGVVLAAAQAAVAQLVADAHRVGRAVRRSALFAALHQPGVDAVTLTAPAADVLPTSTEAPWCTAINVTVAP
jgi:phage-related baseplate assembly protein